MKNPRAFARPASQLVHPSHRTVYAQEQDGATLLDLFAAAALIGIRASETSERFAAARSTQAAAQAYSDAEAMLEERELVLAKFAGRGAQ